jgi:dihydroxyacid dehydratase/phosphogluconate dehydratase
VLAELPWPTLVVVDACSYTNIQPCNNKFRELADCVAAEIERLGGKAFIAMTPVISDGESQGSKAMRYAP